MSLTAATGGSSGLSARECQVAALVARGASNKGIAAILGISRHTVGSHLKNIFTKLEIHNRTGLTLYAAREGLIRLQCEPALAKRLTVLAHVRYEHLRGHHRRPA